MKRLKQIDESKKIISEGFLKLLQTHHYDEISISKIANESQIGRNTFYNHFSKKDDVIDYIIETHFENIKELLSNIEKPTIKDILILRFQLLKDNPCLAVFQNNENTKYLVSRFRDENLHNIDSSFMNDKYFYEFFQGGVSRITSKWIADGMCEPPQEIVSKIMKYQNFLV